MSEIDITPKQRQMKVKPRLIIIIIAIIVLIVLVSSSFYVVDQTEEAVVLRFGKFYKLGTAGLHMKMPFGIDKNYNIPTQVIQNMSFGFRTERAGITSAFAPGDYPEESIMLTGDLNIIDVEWIVQYRITDPKAWLFNLENKDKTIRDISQSVVNLLVGDRSILDVIGAERANIEAEGSDRMNKIFESYGLGTKVITVKLRNIVPPKGAVQDAFEDVNKAVQDMNRLINEGKEAYNKDIPRAKGDAARIIQEAQGYAAERVNKARGDVARFNAVFEEYRKSRDVTRTRLYIEMMEEIFKASTGTDLIDKDLGNFIPLKQLRGTAQGGVQ